ncbi:unnamed protein product [Symbiodinium natans]|uniref:Uncharacterized protein n=1 Tax=Symbiodinium natans TaxID=878477 RepID=A0A812KV95_9DINO|nr:unnamed protein product [Symbiodinium natans]
MVYECPAGGKESSCCKEATAPSIWLLDTFRCWASFGGRGDVYASGPLRSWCCLTHFETCFGAGFPPERCCVRPPEVSVANALGRGQTWGSLGKEYHARCRGEAQHPAGVHCVPSWFAGNSRTLLGHILYCGPKVTSFAFHLLMMVGMNYALSLHDPSSSLLGDSDLLASCFRFYDERLRANRFHALEIGAVLLSPTISDFRILEEGLGLDYVTRFVYTDARAKVVGLPTSSNGTWAWPILQLRNAYWKLSAVRYPFAYRSWAEPHFGDMSHCFGGDTTSGTRVYNSSVLRRSYDIEAARFHPDASVQTKCITPGTMAEAISANSAGMVVPYCIRLALKHAMQKLKGVWEVVAGPGAKLLPVFGSSLSVLRLGSANGEVMPWDYDADLVLIQEGLDVYKLQHQLEANGFTVRHGDVATPYAGAGGSELHLQTEYLDPELNATAEVDLWIELDGNSGTSEVLRRSHLQLNTLPVTVDSDVLHWTRFRGATAPRIMLPPEEMHGIKPVEGFQCPDHSACIPTGGFADGFLEGAMPDSFAKLDAWD